MLDHKCGKYNRKVVIAGLRSGLLSHGGSSRIMLIRESGLAELLRRSFELGRSLWLLRLFAPTCCVKVVEELLYRVIFKYSLSRVATSTNDNRCGNSRYSFDES